MKKYSVYFVRFEIGKDSQCPEPRSFESILDANNYFFYLIGSHSFELSDCSCRVPKTIDSSCLKSFCISNGVISYYFYLQENL